jgi:hypothetical protein
VVGTKVLVEGGGDSKDLRIACRRGFSQLFAKAGLRGKMPRIVACGSRDAAYEDFCTASSQEDRYRPVLVVDSEGPVASGDGPWEHLEKLDQWSRPEGAGDDQCHLMVQCMESWFLADRKALADYFGQGFQENNLPRRPEIESIPKRDVLEGLRRSTRSTKTKGRYGKGAHSFDILEQIDPSKLRRASPHADRLLKALGAPDPS